MADALGPLWDEGAALLYYLSMLQKTLVIY